MHLGGAANRFARWPCVPAVERLYPMTMIQPRDLLCPRPEGLYCAPGDFYIDPVRPVARAVITHGHSDHARPGHGAVLATPETLDIMAERYGLAFSGTIQAAPYGEAVPR